MRKGLKFSEWSVVGVNVEQHTPETTMLMTSDFKVGEQIRFGRGRGEQTLGTVIKVNRKKLKVRQDEARGTMRSYAIGTVWTVPPSLCSKTDGTAKAAPAAPVVAKAKRTEAQILADAENITFALEPERLYCDGERSPSAARRVAASLRQQFRELERELGRPITEFGNITGRVTSTRKPAKESGYKVGDKVTFNAKGNTVVGYVKRVNTKTVSVQPIGGDTRYWRVSPGILRAA